jgi:hypothetical protein
VKKQAEMAAEQDAHFLVEALTNLQQTRAAKATLMSSFIDATTLWHIDLDLVPFFRKSSDAFCKNLDSAAQSSHLRSLTTSIAFCSCSEPLFLKYPNVILLKCHYPPNMIIAIVTLSMNDPQGNGLHRPGMARNGTTVNCYRLFLDI